MADDPWVGVELAGYRLEALVGRGGVGVVYRATHLRLQRPAAVKLLASSPAADPEYQRRFEREARLAASLHHPYIVPIYDAGHDRGVLYLAMPYIDGPNLATLIDTDGPMDVSRICTPLSGVAEALDSAHQAGLVHRDVKPANILITPAQPPELQRGYLCDFGIARHVDATTSGALTSLGQFLGTLRYCAPEQIQGQPLDGRADQYALACVIYHCLTGQPPYSADEPAAIMFAHLSAEPPRPSAHRTELPAGIDPVITRAMAKQPGDRYPDCATFLQALMATTSRTTNTTNTVAGTGTPAPPVATPAPSLTTDTSAVHGAAHTAGAPETVRQTVIWPPGHRPPAPPEPIAPPPEHRPEWYRRLDRYRHFLGANRRSLIVAGVVVALLALAGSFYFSARAARTVVLLGPDERGGEPFGPSLVVDGGITPTATLDPAARRNPVGDQDGLYFDAMSTSSCNRRALDALLKNNHDLAGAWGSALGTTGADAPAYLATLTPVRLRADTRVTAFSYADGEARPYRAILQAGTAVLIDNRGLPTVDCANSSPLAAPTSLTDPHYAGTAGAGFDPTGVIEIHPAGTVVREFGLVNSGGTAPFRRQPGNDGTHDVPQLPITGRLDGPYTFTGSMTQCVNFEMCQQDIGEPFVDRITFSGCPNTCTMVGDGIHTQDGVSFGTLIGNYSLTRQGALQYGLRGEGPENTTCQNGKATASGSWQTTFTVTSSAAVNGIWKATQVKMDQRETFPKTGTCNAADRTFSLTGTAQ